MLVRYAISVWKSLQEFGRDCKRLRTDGMSDCTKTHESGGENQKMELQGLTYDFELGSKDICCVTVEILKTLDNRAETTSKEVNVARACASPSREKQYCTCGNKR